VAFPASLDGVCRKHQFSLPLEPAYSGLQGFGAARHIIGRQNIEPRKNII